MLKADRALSAEGVARRGRVYTNHGSLAPLAKCLNAMGGKRAGAGRKHGPSSKKRRENLSITFDAETARKIRAEAARRNITIGAVLDELAKRLPKPD